MKLFNFFKKQFSSVIEWKNQDTDLLWYKHPSENNEITNASKLIVSPGQGCVLVYKGKIIDFIQEEGIYNLKTDNHPFITNLIKIRQLFESEHKLFVYFYRKAENLNQGWGTSSPVKYMDSIYQFPIAMGANGNFSYCIEDVDLFFRKVSGSKDTYTTLDIKEILSNQIPQKIASNIAQKKYSYQDVDAQLNIIADEIKKELQSDFFALGVKITDFEIIGTYFDEATQQRISRVADVTADSMAADKAGLSYVELEKLRALRDAAKNEGGLAGSGLQFGVGMKLGEALNNKTDKVLSSSDNDLLEKVRKLKILLDEEIISQDDFDQKKSELLRGLQ